MMKITLAKFGLLAGCSMFAGAIPIEFAQEKENPPSVAQIVALDECDPVTFNAALGPDFCRNVTLGAFTTLDNLFKQAHDGTPDPNWDFEPDTVHIKKGTTLVVTDQGGEPHTFTLPDESCRCFCARDSVIDGHAHQPPRLSRANS